MKKSIIVAAIVSLVSVAAFAAEGKVPCTGEAAAKAKAPAAPAVAAPVVPAPKAVVGK